MADNNSSSNKNSMVTNFPNDSYYFNWNLKDKILLWICDSWELLRTKSLEKWDNNKIIITLNEWKKRHIRRIFKSLWYEVTDLQRIRIWNYVLWDLKEGEYQAI